LDYLKDNAGNLMLISGVLFQGMGRDTLLLSPTADLSEYQRLQYPGRFIVQIAIPTLEEWGEIIKRTDDPLIFERDLSGGIKAIHRKQTYAISGVVQQQIWARDGFQCLYCGGKMGKYPLTVDHFVPLELGGKGEPGNYVSACRMCAKAKGCIHPKDFCESRSLDYDGLCMYLAGKCSLAFVNHLA
jgi:hypothetical protein